MNFTKFISSEPDEEGVFEPGRIYILDNLVRGVEVEGQAGIRVGEKRIEVSFEDKRFRFYEEVHALWRGTGPKLGDRPGSVVIVNGSDEDGLYVVGKGFVHSRHLILVDHLVLHPGVWVMDKYTSKWSQIQTVDNKNCVSVSEKTATRRPLVEFIFPVSKGEIVGKPVVLCKDDFMAEKGLVVGNSYSLLEGWPGGAGMVVVAVKDSSEKAMASRFSWLG